MKELMPKENFFQKELRRKPPKQWIYVIENQLGSVKVGVSAVPEARIRALERSGGFFSRRKLLLGPYQNGYEIENRIHEKFHSHRVNGEWFNVLFSDIAENAKKIGETFGQTEILSVQEPDMQALIDAILPHTKEIIDFEETIERSGFMVIYDPDGSVWLESEFGLIRPEFLMDFMRIMEEK